MSIGRSIERAMKARGLNQSELARLCGVTKQAVSEWINGQDPSMENLRKVAKACKTTLVVELVE